MPGWCLPHLTIASAAALLPWIGDIVDEVTAPISLPLPSSVCSNMGVPVIGILSLGKDSLVSIFLGWPRLYILATISCPR